MDARPSRRKGIDSETRGDSVRHGKLGGAGLPADELAARPAREPEPALIVLPVLVSAVSAASMVGISPRWWAELVRTGHAPEPVRLGRRALWSRAVLEQWAANGCPPRVAGDSDEA
jgi:predicted DNA-binding transcriptional regulator AlpA